MGDRAKQSYKAIQSFATKYSLFRP